MIPFTALGRRRRKNARRNQPSSAHQSEQLQDRKLLTIFMISATADGFDDVFADGVAQDDEGVTSLRAAIQESNAVDGIDTIYLTSGTFSLSRDGDDDDNAIFGDLDITDDLTIIGAGSANTIIDAGDIDRVFDIQAGATVTISGVTIRNGTAQNGAGIRNFGTLRLEDSIVEDNVAEDFEDSIGGGIATANGSTLTLDGVTVRNNSAEIHGGGLYASDSTVTVIDSFFENNSAAMDGGGISVFNGTLDVTGGAIRNNTAELDGGGLSLESAVVSLTEVSVNGNTATEEGGGINAFGDGGELRIFESSITNNVATNEGGGIRAAGVTLGLMDTSVSNNQSSLSGGGVYAEDTTTELINSLLSANSAVENGGGISSVGTSGTLGVSNSTISGNSATLAGGGIYHEASATAFVVNATVTANSAGTIGGGIRAASSATLGNTIVAQNIAVTDDFDVSGAFATLGSNIIGRLDDATGLFFEQNNDQIGFANDLLDPGLAPLEDNGGPTLSHGLLLDSVAIDAGITEGAAAFDQTGKARNYDGDRDGFFIVDIGAVEYVNETISYAVNTTNDTFDVLLGDDLAVDGDGTISLRSAIQETNTVIGEAIIALPAGTYSLTREGTGEDLSSTGDLDINDHLTIMGAGADSTIIDGSALDRIFHVAPSVTLVISGVTIQNGAADFGAGLYNEGGNVILQDVVLSGNVASDSENSHGGGIVNDQGNMLLERVTLSGNSAELDGGAIYTFNGFLDIVDSSIDSNTATRFGGGLATDGGTTSLADTTVSSNTATDDGGGIAVHPGSVLTLTTSTISDNSTEDIGGGIYSQSGNVTLIESTVSGNYSVTAGGGIATETSAMQILRSTIHSNATDGDGGGIANAGGSVTLGLSTISGNTAGENGGGMANYAASRVDATNSTILNNSADGLGGGLWVAGEVNLGNSIVAQNTDGSGQPDISGTIFSRGTNIIGVNNGLFGTVNGLNGDMIGTVDVPLDPGLTDLLDNGGPTLTHVPRTGSVAIDSGTALNFRNDLGRDSDFWQTDQRGRERFVDGNHDHVDRIDIGATEFFGLSFDSDFLSGDLLLTRNGDAIELIDNTAGGTPTVFVQLDADELDHLQLPGTTDSESLEIDFSNGNPLPFGGVELQGTGTSDVDLLSLNGGTASTVEHEFTSETDGSLTVDGRRIDYTSIDRISELLDATDRSIAFHENSQAITLSDSGSSLDGLSTIDRDGYGTAVSVRLSDGDLSLSTGFRDDTIFFESLDDSFTGDVTIDTGNGNDLIDVALLSGNADITTGAGNDTVRSGFGDDMINTGMGNDSVLAGDGDDVVMTGGGRDTVRGGAGNDLLNGQGGSGDQITGGLGDDTLKGGTGFGDQLTESGNVDFTLIDGSLTGLGNDVLENIDWVALTGGSGQNRIDASGFSGRVTLDGSTGSDTLIGGSNRDRIVGGSGNDNLDGGGDNDFILGGSGNDFIFGNDGEDTLLGEGGSDTLQGGNGKDTLDGGGGTDQIFESADVRNFVLMDGQLKGRGTDTLRRMETARIEGGMLGNLIDASRFSGKTTLIGSGGGDTILGGSADDYIDGGGGSDRLRGFGGNDLIEGFDGQDTLIGDGGNDTLNGGGHDDGLSGREGDDVLNGHKGNDTLLGQDGDDTLFGGDDNDTVIGGAGADNVTGDSGTNRVLGGPGNAVSANVGDQIDAPASEIDERFSIFVEWATT